MKPPMIHRAYKVTTTTNVYGDKTSSGSVALNCRFRDILLNTQDGNLYTTTSDAMAWFEADSGVERDDIIAFEGRHYRVVKAYKARKLRSTNVEFIKTELEKYGDIS